ncbi:DMT family transporter [Neisseria sp. 74A18]|uniref:DMT family transporter n=1 Tax=Neisseria sp. 74A18 TaxID=1696094 RepID=UPI0006CAE26E|nr:DMT family transporter [Neisseria sp. 74A18]KPN73735.1 membrane protein [Neisseria sp. 74A18]
MVIFICMALAAGAALAVQAAINSQLAKGLLVQPLVAATVSFAVGTILLLALCVWKADLSGAWQQMPQQPWWKYLGGLLGAGFVFTTIFLAPKLGITNMLFFVIVGQLLTAAVIDHFGLIGMAARPFHIWHVLGLLMVGLGLAVFFFGRRWLG